MNPPIIDHPSLKHLGQGRWKLLEPFVVDDTELGRLTVPAGFETDLDSVPRLPFAHWLLKGRTVEAAIVHDYAYERGEFNGKAITRAQADELFRRLMAEEGVWWWRRALIYRGVRFGGWRPWARYRKQQAVTA